MTCCAAHWQAITDPARASDACPLCQAVEALEEISTPPGPEFGDHRQRLAFAVALARLTLAILKGEISNGKAEHRTTENQPS